jgi:hypothetical protein
VMGATIRAVGHRYRPVLAVPYQAMGRHQVIVGSSGCGKTNLMMRTWAGWYAAALAAHYRRGAARPLLVVLDCKGGPTPGSRPSGPAACCTPPTPGGSRSGPTRPSCRCGGCRPPSWR